MARKQDYIYLTYAVLGGFALMEVFPILWTVVTSVKVLKDVFGFSVIFSPTLSNYQAVFADLGFGRYLGNSVLIACSSTIFSLLCGTIAAYALVRLRIKGGEWIALGILFTRFIPPIAILLPYFILIQSLGFYDTYMALILAHTALTLPYTIWMMRGFFASLPMEIEESALVDGCSRLQVFIRIALPLALPGFVATTVLAFIFSWNDFIYAFIIAGYKTSTAPVFLTRYIGEMGVLWTQMAAAGVVVALPVIIFSVFMQKRMAKGLTFGALKG